MTELSHARGSPTLCGVVVVHLQRFVFSISQQAYILASVCRWRNAVLQDVSRSSSCDEITLHDAGQMYGLHSQEAPLCAQSWLGCLHDHNVGFCKNADLNDKLNHNIAVMVYSHFSSPKFKIVAPQTKFCQSLGVVSNTNFGTGMDILADEAVTRPKLIPTHNSNGCGRSNSNIPVHFELIPRHRKVSLTLI